MHEAGRETRLRVSAAAGDRPPVLEVRGEFDLDSVPEVDRFLRRALGPLYQHESLVIDLGGATFVDSGFIAFLARLATAQRSKRRELLLVRPRGQVRRLFGMVGLANVVPVFESIETAVETLTRGGTPVIPPAFSSAGA